VTLGKLVEMFVVHCIRVGGWIGFGIEWLVRGNSCCCLWHNNGLRRKKVLANGETTVFDLAMFSCSERSHKIVFQII